MAKHVCPNAVDVTETQLEECQLSHCSPSLSLPGQGHCLPRAHSKTQAKNASTEPAEMSHSHPMAPGHRPTLQHHPTCETLHNTGKCWLSQLCFKATQ